MGIGATANNMVRYRQNIFLQKSFNAKIFFFLFDLKFVFDFFSGPDEWGGICQSGKKQSPIDINADRVVKTKFPQFEFSETFLGKSILKVANNGHSIVVTIQNDTDDVFIGGGGLEGRYIFKQLHFHWGSEHTIKGVR